MLRALALAALLLFVLLWTLRSAPVAGNVLASTTTADAATTSGALITVTTRFDQVINDGNCSLREAIQAADTNNVVDSCAAGNGADTLYLPAGIYALASGQITLSSAITLQGSITGVSSLNAIQKDRVLYIQPDAVVTLLHLDIRNGKLPKDLDPNCDPCEVDDGEGAGIANFGTTTIAHSNIHGNQTDTFNPVDPSTLLAARGGGIFNAGTMTLTHSTIFDNYSGGGGGIYNDGTLVVAHSTIQNNLSGRSGGGIYNSSNMTISYSTISDNASGGGGCSESHGGMVYCDPGWQGGGIDNHGTLHLTSSTISDNKAGNGGCNPFHGGILYCGVGAPGGGISNHDVLSVINSTVSRNSPGNGGCGRVDEENLACSASGEGGGIHNTGWLSLVNSTVARNMRGKSSTVDDPTDGADPVETLAYGKIGGVYNETMSVSIKNSILANNEGSDCGGELTSQGFNLIQFLDDCQVSGNYIHWGAHLGPLQDNGGPTRTHALNQNSPAIDAGDCTSSTATVDQRGEPRPQGDGCDIGAYESPFTSTFEMQSMHLPLVEHHPETED